RFDEPDELRIVSQRRERGTVAKLAEPTPCSRRLTKPAQRLVWLAGLKIGMTRAQHAFRVLRIERDGARDRIESLIVSPECREPAAHECPPVGPRRVAFELLAHQRDTPL